MVIQEFFPLFSSDFTFTNKFCIHIWNYVHEEVNFHTYYFLNLFNSQISGIENETLDIENYLEFITENLNGQSTTSSNYFDQILQI